MLYYVYKITNEVNKKCYIGFTENPKIRWTNHKNTSKKRPLYLAFKKYGIENFMFKILYKHKDKQRVLIMEKKLVEEFNSQKYGYNLSPGGFVPTENNKKIVSENMKKNNPMTKLRHNKGTFKSGHKPTITLERNEKIRKSRIGNKNVNYGNKDAANHLHTYETCIYCKRLMNVGNLERWHNNKCGNKDIL